MDLRDGMGWLIFGDLAQCNEGDTVRVHLWISILTSPKVRTKIKARHSVKSYWQKKLLVNLMTSNDFLRTSSKTYIPGALPRIFEWGDGSSAGG